MIIPEDMKDKISRITIEIDPDYRGHRRLHWRDNDSTITLTLSLGLRQLMLPAAKKYIRELEAAIGVELAPQGYSDYSLGDYLHDQFIRNDMANVYLELTEEPVDSASKASGTFVKKVTLTLTPESAEVYFSENSTEDESSEGNNDVEE